ncbi:ASKHA domain-containing protein [Candidatus Bipolaricaulota bacterium]
MAARRNHPETTGKIILTPGGTVLEGATSETILKILQESGVPVGSSCGGLGTCGECRIRFVERVPGPTVTDLECFGAGKVSQGWRLACQHSVDTGGVIEAWSELGELNHKAQDDQYLGETKPNPAVRLHEVSLDPASCADREALAVQLREGLERDFRIPGSVLEQLCDSAAAKSDTYSVITSGEEVLEILRGMENTIHGLAIDVGTTTLAVYLFDLQTGRQLGVAAAKNPQARFGADVISRIAHVRREGDDGLSELHDTVVEGLNQLISRLTEQSSITLDSIYDVTVVGNSTMLHLLLSVDPTGIDVSPYVPKFTNAVKTRADLVGLATSSNAVVRTLPAISAYVGADIVAGIIATGLHEAEDRILFLDVGTNGEIVLAVDGQLTACSTAAGPAFEGASIVQGMPALHGAIESIRIHEDGIQCTVIGDCVATGICGTGLLSVVAECLQSGAIDVSGRIRGDGSALANRIDGDGNTRRIRLTDGEEPVYLYQSDIREFQLAKAAIRAGIELLLQHAGLRASDLDRILVCGAFSTRVSSSHLIETGFLPRVDPLMIQVAGNVAGQGARQILLNCDLMDEASRLSHCVEYLELSGDSRFSGLYLDHIALGSDSRR